MTYVLVHGAGGNGAQWDRVRPLLERAGRRVFTPDLSRLDDPYAGFTDHAGEVAELINGEDVNDVVLVGHSYGGMVITGVAELVPERIARLVYLDAFAPRNGESAFDTRPDLRESLGSQVTNGLIPPLDPWFAGVETEEDAELLRRTLTTTPLWCFEEKALLTSLDAAHLPRSYIFCTRSGYGQTAERARTDGWDYHELDTAHMAMLTAPGELAALLVSLD